MAINSLVELKAHLTPFGEVDFKGRPFITEARMHADADVADYFTRNRHQWHRVPHADAYRLADSVLVRG